MNRVDASTMLLAALGRWLKSLFAREHCNHLFGSSGDRVRHYCQRPKGHSGAHQDICLWGKR